MTIASTIRRFAPALLAALVLGSVAPSAQRDTPWISAGASLSTGDTDARPGEQSPAIMGGDAVPDFVVSPSAGSAATRILSGANGTELGAGFPFGPGFGGGVRMAAGDLTGNGVADLVAAMGPGGGFVRLLDGSTVADLGGGYPFGGGFAGGVSVAIGDVNGDGRNDIVTAQASGGGAISVFNGINYTPIFSVSPFGPGYTGGLNVAAGDVNGDGRADVIAGQAASGIVAIIDAVSHIVTLSGEPFGGANGVFVAAGDVTGDGRAEVIAAPGSGNGPVLVYNVSTLSVVTSFTPYQAGFTGGVRVAATDVSGDGRVEILTVPGPGIPAQLKVFDGATFANVANYTGLPGGFGSGAFIAAPPATGIRFSSASNTIFAAGIPNSFTVTAGATPPVTSITVAGALPAGVTFTDNGNGTATLGGTPDLSARGVYPLTFIASNGQSSPAVQAFTLTVNQPPSFVSSPATTFGVGVASSFTVQTIGSPRPTLTMTGTLPTGVTFTNNGNGTATIAGVPAPGTTGTYPLTLTADNTIGSPATQAFVLTIQNDPFFTSPDTALFQVGVAGVFNLTTAAAPPVTTITRSGSLPNGLSFTDNGNGTATLSGTPAVGSAGIYAVQFTASNGVSNGSQTVTITVRLAPAITSVATTTFTQGVAGAFTVTTTGFPTPTISRVGALPAGVVFTDNGNGTAAFTGTPAPGTAGSYPISLSASNGVAPAASQAFVLLVSGAPAITSAASATFVANSPGTFVVTTTGGPAPTVSATGALPTGVTFVNNGNGTATLGGTPASGTGGTYPLTLTATNGIGSPATQAFTLTVNQAPAITSANATAFTVNVPSSFTVTSTGFPNATVSVTGSLPTGVTATPNPNGTATISGTPALGTIGTYPLTVQAANGVGTPATQQLTLTITSCTIVTVQPGSGSLAGGTYNSFYSQAITATGGSGHSFALTGGALPAGLTLSPGGALTGTPSTTGTFNFTVTATASDTCTGSATYSLLVRPDAQGESFVNGVGNTQYSVGAGTPATPAVVVAGTVLSNDAGPGALSVGPASIATSNGGQVSLAANGTFLYTPAVGFAGPADTFTYTLTDGNGVTDTATVTINMSGVVWYVNASAMAGDGRSHSPFTTMPAAATAAQAGQVIYVHGGSPAGATALKSNQRLQGAGESYSINGLTIPAGAAPTLQGTVTLANGVAVRALNVNAGGSAAIVGTGLTGAETLTSVSITGGGSGLTLTSVGGTFIWSGGAISGLGPGGGVTLSGGTGTVTIGASVTTISGRSVSVQNRTAGSVAFSGAISDTGQGILLNANTGSTIAFSGGLTLTTGANAAFTATGGGTVTATQNNTSIVNSIVATTGTGLNVSNTQIGAAGLTFRSITSVGGAGIGIILDNTGTAPSNGGLTVEGNGTATSGGTLSGKSGADGSLTQGIGLYLNSTRNPTFKRMLLQSFANSAVVGRNVAGDFLLENSSINSSGSTAGIFEGPVVFGLPNPGGVNGLQGTATFRNTTIAGGSGAEHNVAAYGQSGSMALVIERTTTNPADCKVESNSTTIGAHGVRVLLEGSATGSLTISQCLVRGNRDAAVQAMAIGSANLTVTVAGSDIGRSGQGERGVVLTNGDDATLTATVDGNNFFDLPGPSVTLGQVPGDASAASLLQTTISNNIIGTGSVAAPTVTNSIVAALSSSIGAAARTRLLIADNFVEHYGLQPAVLIHAPDAASSPDVDVTLTLNHMDMMDLDSGPAANNGPLGLVVRNTQSSTASLCANIAPNTFHWIPIGNGTGGGISLEQAAGASVTLERGSQTLGTPASTVLAANNGPYTNGISLPGSSTSVSGSIAVVEDGTCQVPVP